MFLHEKFLLSNNLLKESKSSLISQGAFKSASDANIS